MRASLILILMACTKPPIFEPGDQVFHEGSLGTVSKFKCTRVWLGPQKIRVRFQDEEKPRCVSAEELQRFDPVKEIH